MRLLLALAALSSAVLASPVAAADGPQNAAIQKVTPYAVLHVTYADGTTKPMIMNYDWSGKAVGTSLPMHADPKLENGWKLLQVTIHSWYPARPKHQECVISNEENSIILYTAGDNEVVPSTVQLDKNPTISRPVLAFGFECQSTNSQKTPVYYDD